MKNRDKNILLFKMIGEFLSTYLVKHRNFSKKTALAYKQSFNMFRIFLKENKNIGIVDMTFDSFSQENIYAFLNHIKETRKVSIATLNLRLSAIKSFLKYCSEQDVSLVSYYMNVKKIHDFKPEKTLTVKHLTEDQIKHLLTLPDLTTSKGRRNRFIIIFLYETGLRIQELLDLKVSNIIDIGNVTKVQVMGKGNKTRYVPILEMTKKFLHQYLDEFHRYDKDYNLIYTIHNGIPTQMKQGAIDSMLKKYALEAHEKDSTFPVNLHAHMLRHSIGMAMYKNGIPISYIKDFLGHTNINTTSIYSHADESVLRAALEKVATPVEISDNQSAIEKKWKGQEEYLLELGCLV